MAKKSAPTIVTFLLDRSGSMASILDDTIGAFNTYLGELKKGSGISFTFLQFDSQSVDTVCKGEPVGEVPELTRATFVPRGMTPLIDACYKTIKAVEAQVAEMKGKPKVAICFQTDGQENCSREHTMVALNDLIKAKTAEGWDFSFMGASIDAYAPAAAMGIGAANTVAYNAQDKDATRAAFSARGLNTVMFGSGAMNTTAYSPAQKLAAGDDLDLTIKATVGLKKKPVIQPIVDDIKL